MKNYKLYQVDAFTTEKFTGNPAGVVLNAEGLEKEDMQKIARELNNSETAFIFESNNEDYDVHTRYFTPSSEVPICGHATIGSMYIYAKENSIKNKTILNKTGAGILPVDIAYENDDYRITMTQGKIEFGDEIKGENKKVLLKGLGIGEKDLIKDTKIQIVSTGHSKVMIPIKSRELLNNLTPDYNSLSKLSSRIGCNGFYVFVLDEDENYKVCGRMFAPAIGINEDPVTGNANGPLGAYLVKYGLVDYHGDEVRFMALQGEAMGRKGEIEVRVTVENECPVQVKIVGNAVSVFETEISI
ncbi:MAG: PhzF family isomerase [Firmicutes bacterium]|jgi:PhzF family phenazine biosynthesis protein|nr:PhzF family isomerase [Bacillota bacterium]